MKEKIIISFLVIATLVSATYLAMLPPRNAETVEFQTVLKGQYSGISNRETIIINSKEEWTTFMRNFNYSSQDLGIEDITFEEGRYTYIVVTMGENQTTGYEIEIKEVYEYKDHIKLYVIREVPCAGCILEEKITRPFHIIKIAKTNKDILR
ncbi:MAG: hypothetical protein APG12_00521 [Candidatus Methanofastidiosum methylothiophilum]|uniref:PrcB C-terminal domain-containing protein n=1 Tax=Candidatus Methanofastidiosum methylothiophilum TaxID=1705564 RepID=A0A150IT21_9EURY|nr:MAG: hypothetical protein APG10_00430 [Candidatus Methanofastidiosum methylthiophilus]KYC48179.1 MAG: hypothetical protein APG11_00540 [Candidatus Methanofastidiosum methylthiophilus]KYC50834.1 MAG: hypothetical protein APG12_00521 [Candidatus Methanofastidiosum methylthiophilus]